MKSKKSTTPKRNQSVKKFLEELPDAPPSKARANAKAGSAKRVPSKGAGSKIYPDVLYPNRAYAERLSQRAYPFERHYAALEPELFERLYAVRFYADHRTYPDIATGRTEATSLKRAAKSTKKKTR